MAFSTEFVAKADEYQTIIQTVNTSSTVIQIPDGVWMCSLIAFVDNSSNGIAWIELNGNRASVGIGPVNDPADLGVVAPSFTGGRSISIRSNVSRSMNFYAAKIGY